MNTNKQDYNREYNQSFAGRVRTGKQSHAKRIAPLTPLDTLSGKELEKIWKSQNGECAACHAKFDSLDDAEIAHISPNGFFRAEFLQLLCHKDNIVQGKLVIPFAWLEREYGKTFYQLYVEFPEWIKESFFMDDNAAKRVEKRIRELGG